MSQVISPLPWSILEPEGRDDDPIIMDATGRAVMMACNDQTVGIADADARYIIRAVNCHAKLVAALKEARDCIGDRQVTRHLDALITEAGP